MLLDGLPFSELDAGNDFRKKTVAYFAAFLERKLGAKFVFDRQAFPEGRPDLKDEYVLADKLKDMGLLKSLQKIDPLPDIPRFKYYYAQVNVGGEPMHAGGGSFTSSANALMAALAETVERYIWLMERDFLKDPVRCSTREIARHGTFIPPSRFSGFADAQRAKETDKQYDESTEFVWTKAYSLISKEHIYIPAQTATGRRRSASGAQLETESEPLIRNRHTIGLATWPTREGAWLSGALEDIEREAYMILWWNQLTMPRISKESLKERFPSLALLFKKFDQYRFRPHIIQMPTDAPTHAIAVVLEDLSGNSPLFSIGLKAHRSLSFAVEKASIEALRGYQRARRYVGKGFDPATPVGDIGHIDRLDYWALPENAKKLAFLIEGPEIDVPEKPWDTDTIEQQLSRVIAWCRENSFELVSVPLTSSKKNSTGFHIEVVIIPDLQQTHLHEKNAQLGGNRWKEVPRKLGLPVREKMFTDAPHPFA